MDSNKKRCSRVTKTQKDLLISFMHNNKPFARGQFNGLNAHQNSFEMWETLCVELNSNGPITKTVEQWKKCWTDLKSGVRKEFNKRKAFMNRTGGGSFLDAPRDLTDMEEKILSIISVDAVDGDGSTPESGVPINTSVSNDINDEKDDSEGEPDSKIRKIQSSSSYNSALSEAKKMQQEFNQQFFKLEDQNNQILALNRSIEAQNKQILAQNKQILGTNNLISGQNEEI